MEKILESECMFKLLEWIDRDLAETAKGGGCRHCEEKKLHKGDYARKPRGIGRRAGWDKRYSFDCSRCRRRTTPVSVRFLGRRVYAGVVVVLASAMMYGASPTRIEQLQRQLGISDAKTLERWRSWWQEHFVASGFWTGERSRFMPALDESMMAAELVGRFGAKRCSGMVSVLRFLSPITVPGGLEGRAM